MNETVRKTHPAKVVNIVEDLGQYVVQNRPDDYNMYQYR